MRFEVFVSIKLFIHLALSRLFFKVLKFWKYHYKEKERKKKEKKTIRMVIRIKFTTNYYSNNSYKFLFIFSDVSLV